MAEAMKGASRKLGIMRELLVFLWERKLWWLMPMVIILLVFGLLLVFAQSSAVAPFIYTLF
jgi:drug/metabolite transporter superfamily protein YnfA